MQSVLQKEEYLEEVEQQEQQVVWAKGQRLYTFLLAGLLVSGLIVGSILAYEGCSYSYYPFTESVFNDIWNNILLNDNFLCLVCYSGR